MKRAAVIAVLIFTLFIPSVVPAIEKAERITDREIVERLTRLEEGQKALENQIKQLREDMNKQFDGIDKQFDRVVNIMSFIVLAFAGIVAVTIGFAIWDRRTMIRPFEVKVKKIEDEITENRTKLNDLLNAFKTLGKTDKKVAEILKRFNLL